MRQNRERSTASASARQPNLVAHSGVGQARFSDSRTAFPARAEDTCKTSRLLDNPQSAPTHQNMWREPFALRRLQASAVQKIRATTSMSAETVWQQPKSSSTNSRAAEHSGRIERSASTSTPMTRASGVSDAGSARVLGSPRRPASFELLARPPWPSAATQCPSPRDVESKLQSKGEWSPSPALGKAKSRCRDPFGGRGVRPVNARSGAAQDLGKYHASEDLSLVDFKVSSHHAPRQSPCLVEPRRRGAAMVRRRSFPHIVDASFEELPNR